MNLWYSIVELLPFEWAAEGSMYFMKNALLALLKAQGYWNAYGVVTSPNPQSDAMHEALGFVNEGTNPRCGYKMGRWLGITTWRAVLHEGHEEPQPVQYKLPAAQVRKILRAAENGGRWQEL